MSQSPEGASRAAPLLSERPAAEAPEQPAAAEAPEQPAAEVAKRPAAEVAEQAAAVAEVSAKAAETRLTQLRMFVEQADKQVTNTSTTFAIVALAVCGLVLVLLPAIFVVTVGTTRFPNLDYLVTSLIGAVLLIGSVVGLVVDSRGKSQDTKELYSKGAEVIGGRLDQSAANNAAAQLAASGNG